MGVYHLKYPRATKVSNYQMWRVRALRIAIGTMLKLLVFMGGALSYTENGGDNYPDIARSNGNFPDHPGTMHTLQKVSNPVDAGKMPLWTPATGDMNTTKIGHFGGFTFAVEVSGNYAYTGQGSDCRA